MRRTQISIQIVWIIILCIVGIYQPVYGQLTVTSTPVPQKTDTLSDQDRMTIATLRGVIQAIEALEEQVQRQQDALETAVTAEEKNALAITIGELTAQIRERQQEFEEIATGIDLTSFEARPKTSFNWQEELHEVFGPIIEQLKELTARPRELERLRSEVAYYEKRLPVVREAIDQVQQRIQQASAQKLKRLLGEVETRWQEREKELERQLAVARYQLEDKEQAQRSLFTSTQEIVREFFKSRGRNLILAVLAFAAIFLVMRYAYRLLLKSLPLGQPGKRPFFLRVLDVAYHILTFLGATLALILVLYISGDWVLLGLALIFLFGIAWAARQTLPMFWEQIKLLLNLSTVREGERVTYNGLPWHVKSLNLYTKLHNPALKGGLIRLPLRELMGLYSRPFHKDEPWFPSREEDLVMLADGAIGKVVMQTPDSVILDTLGGCHKTYPTQTFLQQNPINLSINNFGVFVTFGIDYAHQPIVTAEVPDILREAMDTGLRREDYGEHLTDVIVQFKDAGASSLNVIIITLWNGAASPNYFAISRVIQRIAVETCNAQEWNIPFNQITVHYAQPPEHGMAS